VNRGDGGARRRQSRAGESTLPRAARRPRAQLGDDAARAKLVEAIDDWTRRLQLPTLSTLGVAAADVGRIVARCRGSSMKTNPIVLADTDVERIVAARL
jgi:alcohol dehydrogenase